MILGQVGMDLGFSGIAIGEYMDIMAQIQEACDLAYDEAFR